MSNSLSQAGLAENLAACAVWAGKWDIALEPSIIALGATASLDANNPKEKRVFIRFSATSSQKKLKEQLKLPLSKLVSARLELISLR